MTVRLTLLVVALAALAGCDDSIDTPESLAGTYTLWGALDPRADVQSVRVVPVRDTIGLGTAAPLPVTVTSTDLTTGTETAWRDSVVTFSDGSIGHIYRAAFRPLYGSRHRIVVRREDGGEVSALVAVPPLVEPLRQTPQLAGGLRYPILMPGAPQLNRLRVTYYLIARSGRGDSVVVNATSLATPVEFGWRIVINLEQADDDIQDAAGGNPGDFSLNEIAITGEVASEDWRPPGGVFDFDVLADPQSLSNVRGGFGFVGAAYPFEVRLNPTPCEIAQTSFLSAGPCLP